MQESDRLRIAGRCQTGRITGLPPVADGPLHGDCSIRVTSHMSGPRPSWDCPSLYSGRCNRSSCLRRLPFVMLQQPAESLAADDFVGVLPNDLRRRDRFIRAAIAEALMGTLFVVVCDVLVDQVVQMFFAEDDEMIQTFMLDRSDPGRGDPVDPDDYEEPEMRKPILIVAVVGTCTLAMAAWFSSSHAAQDDPTSQLCVVWSSGDPGVAENVCFMYTHAAKRNGWFDAVHLVVWGPSAKLLAENKDLQANIKAMQKSGVVVEACVACATNYDVADELWALDIDVKPMGMPLSDRLKGPWKVLTF